MKTHVEAIRGLPIITSNHVKNYCVEQIFTALVQIKMSCIIIIIIIIHVRRSSINIINIHIIKFYKLLADLVNPEMRPTGM